MILWLAKFSQLSSGSASRIRHVISDFRDSVTIWPAIRSNRIIYENCLPSYSITDCATVIDGKRSKRAARTQACGCNATYAGFTCSRGVFVADLLELKGAVVWLKP
jgi:hypothetical protein